MYRSACRTSPCRAMRVRRCQVATPTLGSSCRYCIVHFMQSRSHVVHRNHWQETFARAAYDFHTQSSRLSHVGLTKGHYTLAIFADTCARADGWFVMCQVATSLDIESSWYDEWFQGGLQYQVRRMLPCCLTWLMSLHVPKLLLLYCGVTICCLLAIYLGCFACCVALCV